MPACVQGQKSMMEQFVAMYTSGTRDVCSGWQMMINLFVWAFQPYQFMPWLNSKNSHIIPLMRIWASGMFSFSSSILFTFANWSNWGEIITLLYPGPITPFTLNQLMGHSCRQLRCQSFWSICGTIECKRWTTSSLTPVAGQNDSGQNRVFFFLRWGCRCCASKKPKVS